MNKIINIIKEVLLKSYLIILIGLITGSLISVALVHKMPEINVMQNISLTLQPVIDDGVITGTKLVADPLILMHKLRSVDFYSNKIKNGVCKKIIFNEEISAVKSNLIILNNGDGKSIKLLISGGELNKKEISSCLDDIINDLLNYERDSNNYKKHYIDHKIDINNKTLQKLAKVRNEIISSGGGNNLFHSLSLNEFELERENNKLKVYRAIYDNLDAFKIGEASIVIIKAMYWKNVILGGFFGSLITFLIMVIGRVKRESL